MKDKFPLRKIVGLFAIVLAPLLLTHCGGQTSVGKVGPVGPTEPSGYYFEMMVSPNVIRTGDVVDVTVRVWDSNGNNMAGVYLAISGVAIDPKDAETTTTTAGWGGWLLKVESPPGTQVNITVVVENAVLTSPVMILPTAKTS